MENKNFWKGACFGLSLVMTVVTGTFGDTFFAVFFGIVTTAAFLNRH